MDVRAKVPSWESIAAAVAIVALAALAVLGFTGAREARRRAADDAFDDGWRTAVAAATRRDATCSEELDAWRTGRSDTLPSGFVVAALAYAPEPLPRDARLRDARRSPNATAALSTLAADATVDPDVRAFAAVEALRRPANGARSGDLAPPTPRSSRARFALDRRRARDGFGGATFLERLTGLGADGYVGVPPVERAYAAQDHADASELVDALRALDAVWLEPDADGAQTFVRADGSLGFAWRRPGSTASTQVAWVTATDYAARCLAVEPDVLSAETARTQLDERSVTLRAVPLQLVPGPQMVARADAAGSSSYASRLAQVVAALVLCAACAGLLVRLARRRNELDRQRNDFVCSVTHELKTPLSNILLYAETLERLDGADPARVPEFARTIRAEAERLRGRIQQVLDVAAGRDSIEAAPGATFDPLAVVEAVIAEATPGARAKGATIVLASQPPVPAVRGSLELLAQAVSGLLDNAVKFGGAGIVRVRVRCADREVLVDVADEGPGIAAADRPHVFEPFWRASSAVRSATPGSGLGLALVKRCVERLRGRVELVSRSAERGATFRIALPAEA